MNREQKAERVAELKERLGRSGLTVLTDFTGLAVEDMTTLRAKLKAVGGEYYVSKNTLIRLAIKNTPAEGMAEHLVGPNGLAMAYDDVAALAKTLNEFAKEKKKLEIKAGLLEGAVIDLDQIKRLADLPSREVLLAQLLGAMNAVPTSFVSVLAAVPRNLLGVLKAIEDQKSEAAA